MLPTLEDEAVALATGAALALFIPHGPGERVDALAAVWNRVRVVLARLALAQPDALRIVRLSGGKPTLAGGAVAFNVSHARGCSLLALARRGEIGCDVENRLLASDATDLSPIVLHPAERDYLGRLVEDVRSQAFARCWVRKEALLKAQGTGFADEPRSLDVLPAQQAPAVDCKAGRMVLHDAPPQAGVTAAVATGEPHCQWAWLAPQDPSSMRR
jgi:4'-phosphopantetheinyl transferase